MYFVVLVRSLQRDVLGKFKYSYTSFVSIRIKIGKEMPQFKPVGDLRRGICLANSVLLVDRQPIGRAIMFGDFDTVVLRSVRYAVCYPPRLWHDFQENFSIHEVV